MKFKLILASVTKELTEKAIDSAKKAGATGATIIPARGVGSGDTKTFLGLTIEGPTEVILFLVEEHAVDAILDALLKDCRLQDPDVGLALVLPVDKVVGIERQLQIFKERARDQYL